VCGECCLAKAVALSQRLFARERDDHSYIIIVSEGISESESLSFFVFELSFDFTFVNSIELNRDLSFFLSLFDRFLYYFSTRKGFQFSG